MAAYHVSSAAEQDALDIWLYIARDNVVAADRMMDRFTEIYEALSRNPQMGELVEQYHPRLRRFTIGAYVVYYQPLNDRIVIVRTLHGARDQDAHF